MTFRYFTVIHDFIEIRQQMNTLNTGRRCNPFRMNINSTSTTRE